jgi:hypothetical protein
MRTLNVRGAENLMNSPGASPTSGRTILTGILDGLSSNAS